LHHHRLYKTCQWDDKVLRRLIGDGKLASRKTTTINSGAGPAGGAPSSTASSISSSWECPICFCNYDEINRTTCCEKEICTECYLQLKPPPKNAHVSCPFCVGQRLKVERCLETAPKEVLVAPTKSATSTTSSEDEKDLLQHHTSMMTAPSSPSPTTNTPGPAAYCLTPEQRQKLEAKVSEQQIHPLAARLAQEEAERRLANELHYLTSNPNLLLVNQQQQHYQQHHHPFAPSSSSSTSQRPQLLHHLPQQREQAAHLASITRTMLLTEEQQLAMAIEASLRTGS
jgi:hypothetical protein